MPEQPELRVTQSKLALAMSILGALGILLGGWTQWNDVRFRLNNVEVAVAERKKLGDDRYVLVMSEVEKVRQEATHRDEKWNDTVGKLNETLAQINLTLKEVQVIQRVKP